MTAFTSMQPQTSSRVSQLAGSPLRQQHKACFSASRRSLAVRASGDGSRVDKFDKHSIIVSPSILSADFAKLGEQIKAVEAAGADWIHVDVMDGRFVPNITIGPLIVAAIRPLTDLPLDTHLMIVHPEERVADFAKAGSDIISVHAEPAATVHLDRTINQVWLVPSTQSASHVFGLCNLACHRPAQYARSTCCQSANQKWPMIWTQAYCMRSHVFL
ncbi:TPA: hypothetical protein ACH3X1_006745 [Trebouxia sp. C0004]